MNEGTRELLIPLIGIVVATVMSCALLIGWSNLPTPKHTVPPVPVDEMVVIPNDGKYIVCNNGNCITCEVDYDLTMECKEIGNDAD